uniref:NELL2-interacting cell ontogeny regulator 1 n=1 Tax=Pelusios castaneus TaxID=367368 RepID=A0A8C8RIH5_9SAUR
GGSLTLPPSRPCVDCHAFEFMQRALQDLKKTAYNLDARVRSVTLEIILRTDCWQPLPVWYHLQIL